jgi:hypothetical protein
MIDVGYCLEREKCLESQWAPKCVCARLNFVKFIVKWKVAHVLSDRRTLLASESRCVASSLVPIDRRKRLAQFLPLWSNHRFGVVAS